jgi:hypothetical protein
MVMKLITPILSGFALLVAILAFASYFANSGQDNRGTSVGFFVGTAVVFAVLAFVSTFFNKQAHAVDTQTIVNTSVRRISLMIVVPVILFIAAIYLYAWWL